MAFELGRALLLSDAVTSAALARALFAVAAEGVPLPRALVALGAVDMMRLEEELARVEAPSVRHVIPVPELLEALPAGLCARLLALPIRRDALTGTIDVAVVDVRDPHAAREIGFILQAPVRVVRAPLSAMESALDRTSASMRGAESLAAPIWMANPQVTRPTPIWGTPVAEDPRRRAPRPAAGSVAPSRVPTEIPPAAVGSVSELPIPLVQKSVIAPGERGPAPAPPTLQMLADSLDERGPATGPWSDVDERGQPVIELHLQPVPTSPYGFAIVDADDGAPGETLREPPPVLERETPTLPFGDPSAILASLRAASSRDQILELLLSGVRMVARRVALLVVKRDAFVGWSCSREFGEETQLRTVQILASEPSALATVIAGGTYLGPLPRSGAHAPLLAVMETATRDVTISAVRVKGRAAVLILADELGDTLLATQRIEELARAAGEALARLVMTARPSSGAVKT